MPPLRAAVPVATSPGVGSPTPLTSPAPPLFVLDPQVDFTLVLGYLNDPRIPRDRKGCYVIDLEALSRMDGVRPVLAEVPRAPLSLADAASCGLRPGAVVHATVQVTIRAGELPTLVCPTAVQLLDATLDGAELPRTCRDAIIGHVVDRVATTRWLPASDRGRLCESAQQAFEVWLVQARDENLAAASRSQVP